MAVQAVSGRVVFDETALEFDGVVHIRVEDASRSDAAARVVARLDLPYRFHGLSGPALEFSVAVPVENPKARYEIRAHASRSGEEQPEPGDQISTESLPVLTGGYSNRVVIRLTRIGA